MKDTIDQMNDVAKIESNITITLVVHDDIGGDTRVEVSFHESKPDTSLDNLIATYVKDSE